MGGAIPILRVGPNLLTTIHVELTDSIAEAFQQDVLRAKEPSVREAAPASSPGASTPCCRPWAPLASI